MNMKSFAWFEGNTDCGRRAGRWSVALVVGAMLWSGRTGWAATNLPSYYAHPAVEDAYGVIAP